MAPTLRKGQTIHEPPGYWSLRATGLESANYIPNRSKDRYTIYIYKDLLHRNSWKYMWGYKIVPTTNLPHYHSCE